MTGDYSQKDISYYGHTRGELIEYLPPGLSKVLDVGCASGNFGQMLKGLYGHTVWGIEPSEVAAAGAAGKLDKVICSGFTEGIPELEGQSFDAIFFNDVLEHLADPEKTLITCKQYLRPGGYIIASIPNIRWYPVILSLLRYKDLKYTSAGVMDRTHLRFFTSKSMRRMFEETGYKVIRHEGINPDHIFRVFNIINFLLFNSQSDMKYKQFVTVAVNAGKD